MRPFEEAVASELAGLLRAGVPTRGVHITVREMVVMRIERGPLGAREVSDAVEAAVRAACRVVRELDAPDELAEIVCRSALEAVRGHGGETARWLTEATSAAYAVLDQLALERPEDPTWRWLARRVQRQ
ncbi:MAG: hypothetical protein DMD96_30090 [Candidatus Rokuibacteriota bacterium]|nr:MAG: hypothetical protein DMD96_30090 [Candidatus Rokubacteria bacterium]